MKQSLILAIIGMAMSMSVHAQVQFSRFKFYVADIMNFNHLQLETKFKVTSERNLKYVHVYFTPVNSVGDAIGIPGRTHQNAFASKSFDR